MPIDDPDAKMGKMIFYKLNGHSASTRLNETEANSIKSNCEPAAQSWMALPLSMRMFTLLPTALASANARPAFRQCLLELNSQASATVVWVKEDRAGHPIHPHERPEQQRGNPHFHKPG